jgi:Ca-activated chloride channel family protein
VVSASGFRLTVVGVGDRAVKLIPSGFAFNDIGCLTHEPQLHQSNRGGWKPLLRSGGNKMLRKIRDIEGGKHLLFVCAFTLIVGASPPSPPDDLIRRGNKALERGDFDDAISLYQQAEERGNDPGLIAFNKATALYQLQQYRKAESHYRMALDDAAIPAERRARTLYNLGDCLVKQAEDKDVRLLRDAIRFFELCLDMGPEDGLRKDAAHNLELAKMLWNKARARISRPPDPNTDEPADDSKPPESKKKEKERDPSKEGIDDGKQKDGDPSKKVDADSKENGGQKEKVDSKFDKRPGNAPRDQGPPVLPDIDQVEQRSPEDTLKTLEAAEKRLHRERRLLRMEAAIPVKPSGRDW